MIKRNLHIILILLLLLDICYSFIQHYHTQLDGDIAGGVVPSSDVQKILDNPFGLNVILKNHVYPNPNRFFAHWVMSAYFNNVPFVFQKFVSPVDSIYLSCALAKIIIQISIIFLIAICICGIRKILKKEILIAAVLITPLFQTCGYRGYMGIIDPSITYTFFYPLPLIFLMLFFLLYYYAITNKEKNKFSIPIKIYLLVMAVVLPLSGPLIPGTILIVCSLILLQKWLIYFTQSPKLSSFQKLFLSINKVPKFFIFIFILLIVISLYSLYIGRNNSINFDNAISIKDRYLRIPAGLYFQFTQKLGWPLLFLMLAINTLIIWKKHNQTEGQKILRLLKWIVIFSAFFIFLLPLGGFRTYRPNILRYDTIMPITICLIFIYGISTYFLINNVSTKYKKYYLSGVIIIMLIFTYADKPNFSENVCERQALETIAQSPEKIVFLKSDCTIMSWEKITDYKDSELNAKLLQYWNVTKEKKLYYQK